MCDSSLLLIAAVLLSLAAQFTDASGELLQSTRAAGSEGIAEGSSVLLSHQVCTPGWCVEMQGPTALVSLLLLLICFAVMQGGFQSEMLNKVNHIRQSKGLPKLQYSQSMDAAASRHSYDMSGRRTMTHSGKTRGREQAAAQLRERNLQRVSMAGRLQLLHKL